MGKKKKKEGLVTHVCSVMLLYSPLTEACKIELEFYVPHYDFQIFFHPGCYSFTCACMQSNEQV